MRFAFLCGLAADSCAHGFAGGRVISLVGIMQLVDTMATLRLGRWRGQDRCWRQRHRQHRVIGWRPSGQAGGAAGIDVGGCAIGTAWSSAADPPAKPVARPGSMPGLCHRHRLVIGWRPSGQAGDAARIDAGAVPSAPPGHRMATLRPGWRCHAAV